MNRNLLAHTQFRAIENTHMALEQLLTQIEQTIKTTEAGNIERSKQSLHVVYTNAKRILDGDLIEEAEEEVVLSDKESLFLSSQ